MRSIFFGLAVGAGAAWAWKRWRRSGARVGGSTRRSPPDRLGHYDLDGVSYDRELGQVVVSGDASR